MPTCGVLSEVANADDDLCAGVMALVVAWIASPLGAFVFFVLILCIRNAVTPQRPFILSPTTGMAATAVAGAGGTLRAVAINMCLLPGGLAFSGSWLLDGDDKKKERIDKLLKHMDDYDIVLLNELWGCWWSSFHTHFYQRAIERGFHVCASPVDPPHTSSPSHPHLSLHLLLCAVTSKYYRFLDYFCINSGWHLHGFWQCDCQPIPADECEPVDL